MNLDLGSGGLIPQSRKREVIYNLSAADSSLKQHCITRLLVFF